jgi:hypothetical protein
VKILLVAAVVAALLLSPRTSAAPQYRVILPAVDVGVPKAVPTVPARTHTPTPTATRTPTPSPTSSPTSTPTTTPTSSPTPSSTATFVPPSGGGVIWQPPPPPPPPPTATPTPCRRVFVLAGQSNMGQEGQTQTAPAGAVDTGIYVWRGGWAPLETTNGITTGPYGPGFAFARRLSSRGIRVGLVYCALSGSSIGDWQRGQSLYDACLARTRGTGVQPTGLLFYQGERDARTGVDPAAPSQPRPTEWRVLFERFVVDLRADTRADLPVVFARIAHHDPSVAAIEGGWATVQAQQDAVSLPRVVMVQTEPATLRDEVHLDDASHAAVGERMAAAYWENHWLDPSE